MLKVAAGSRFFASESKATYSPVSLSTACDDGPFPTAPRFDPRLTRNVVSVVRSRTYTSVLGAFVSAGSSDPSQVNATRAPLSLIEGV